MTSALKLGEEKLGKNDAYIQAILAGRRSDNGGCADRRDQAGRRGVRKSLLDGGEAAVAASTDPMIVAARRLDPFVRESTCGACATPSRERARPSKARSWARRASWFTARMLIPTRRLRCG
jgi:hypothetical protein